MEKASYRVWARPLSAVTRITESRCLRRGLLGKPDSGECPNRGSCLAAKSRTGYACAAGRCWGRGLCGHRLRIYNVDLSTGRVISSLRFDATPSFQPVPMDDMIVLQFQDHTVRCFSARGPMKTPWSQKASADLTTSEHRRANIIYGKAQAHSGRP